MVTDLSYRDIVDALSNHAETIARQCIPQGTRKGVYWVGDLNGKVSVHISGDRKGMVGFWNGQAGNAKGGGTLINLIELAYNCKTHAEAVELAKSRYLGIHRRELTPEEKRRWAEQQRQSERLAQERDRQAQYERLAKVDMVRVIWSKAVPIAGTPAEIYLGSRGLFLADLPGTVWPASLRYHPSCPVSPDDPRSRRYPALIGGVQGIDRKLIAVWRIFLDPNGKALLDRDGAKMKFGFGPSSGGAVRLGPVAVSIHVAEGIETALAVQRLNKNEHPVWATLSTSGMQNFVIPPAVRRLVIWSDGDRHRPDQKTGGVLTPPGSRAASALAARASDQGIEVVIYQSPAPDDWLDVWNTRRRLNVGSN